MSGLLPRGGKTAARPIDRNEGASGFGVIAVGAILAVAVALGGGGQRYGLANLAVQLTAILVLALRPGAFAAFWSSAPLSLRILTALSLLLPLLQVIPLPPAVWTDLPGRGLVQQSFETAGMSGWTSMSVEPLRTLLALSALITPLAILTTGWTLTRERLSLLCALVVALGLFNFFLGSLQLMPAGPRVMFFDEWLPEQVLLGTFANRNSTALLLIGALSYAALAPAPRPHQLVMPIRLALCALLVVAIILTRSRSGLVLAAVPLALAAIRGISWSLSRRNDAASPSLYTRPVLWAAAGSMLVAGLIGALLVLSPGRIADTIDRFEEIGDNPRAYIWEDATYAAQRYWPLGAGMGVFDEVFQVDESLENMTVRRAGRAHNDYIELAIEAGIPGLTIAAAWIVLIGWLSWQARSSRMRWIGWAGAAFLLCIALQSITDYPLRNQAILALGGLSLLLLARSAQSSRERR